MPAPIILVGDIGSTKSTWRWSAERTSSITLGGYNPVMHDASIGLNLFTELHMATRPIEFTEVWYYGSGVINGSVASGIRENLSGLFPRAHITVNSDLMGAAMASCGQQPGNLAILGTGSHAAVFDGDRIVRQAVSLGYILGDEGGGVDIGKSLLQAFFYGEMPDTIRKHMLERLPNGREGLLSALRLSPAPNQYLADFARIAVKLQADPWIQDLVQERFALFVKRHVGPLRPEGPIHIIGSIGCIFAGLIRDELEKAGFQPGKFIQDPALRLFEIHREHETQ